MENISVYDNKLQSFNQRSQKVRLNRAKFKSTNEKFPKILQKLFSANKSDDVFNIIHEYKLMNTEPINQARFYSECIKMLADLDDFKNAWKLVNECQERLPTNSLLFSTKLWLIMYEDRSQKSLQIILDLFNGYINNNKMDHEFNDANVYSTVIECAIKVYSKAEKPCYKQMCDIIIDLRKNKPELLQHILLCRSLIKFDSICLLIERSMELLQMIKERFDINENKILDETTISMMIDGIKKKIMRTKDVHKIDEYIKIAEDLFNKHIDIIGKPSQAIFNSIIGMYAVNGDIISIQEMMNYIETNDNVNINAKIYDSLLLSYVYQNSNELDFNQNFKDIEDILYSKMISPNVQTFMNVTQILEVYGNNGFQNESYNKVKSIYNYFKDKNIQPYAPVFGNLVKIGNHYFRKLIDDGKVGNNLVRNIDEYYNWIFDEIKITKQPIPSYMMDEWDTEINVLKQLS